MVIEWITRVMTRDLDSLGEQIEAYPSDADVWKLVPGVANSAGTLALHLAGNIEHYIGAQLGGTDYVRDREAEFSTRDLPRTRILEVIESARSAVETCMPTLSEDDLSVEFPLEVAGVRLTTGQFLIHLAVHLGYHLGQVDYHRRFLTGGDSVSGMQSIPVLTDGSR